MDSCISGLSSPKGNPDCGNSSKVGMSTRGSGGGASDWDRATPFTNSPIATARVTVTMRDVIRTPSGGTVVEINAGSEEFQ
jgi:hypothetical protein